MTRSESCCVWAFNKHIRDLDEHPKLVFLATGGIGSPNRDFVTTTVSARKRGYVNVPWFTRC